MRRLRKRPVGAILDPVSPSVRAKFASPQGVSVEEGFVQVSQKPSLLAIRSFDIPYHSRSLTPTLIILPIWRAFSVSRNPLHYNHIHTKPRPTTYQQPTNFKMFASKTAILLSLFTLSSSVLATPPACLLAAVNQQPYPANLTAVCGGSNGHKVQQAIASLCGSNVAVAESAFAATCSSAGVTVGMLSLHNSTKIMLESQSC
jgi:hypothetical protein